MYFEQTWPALRLPIGHGSLSSVPVPGSGLSALFGLGQDPTEGGECLQPVSTAERDALRDRIREWTNPHERKHFVEGHPDIGLVYDDIVNRLHGLEFRPKLLRCSKEARDRANRWIAQMDDLGRKVRPTYPKAGATFVPATFKFTVYRGPTYTIRASSLVSKGAAPAPPSAPPGSVVVNGVVYPSSAAAAAAQAAVSTPATPPGPAETTGTAPSFPFELPSLAGEVFGVPTRYLLLGVGGLLAYKFFFAKGR